MSSLVKSFSSLTLFTGLSQLLGMFATIRIARLFAPDIYGQYGVIIATVSIFQVIAALGLRQIVIRTIARDKSNSRVVYYSSLIGRLFGVIVSSIVLLIYQFLHNRNISTIDLLMIASLFSLNFWESLENLAFGNQKMESSGYINFAFNIIWVTCIYIFPRSYFTLELIFLTQIIFQFCKDIFYYAYSRRYNFLQGPLEKKDVMPELRVLIKDSSSYYLMYLLSLLTSQLPILLLNANSSSTEVGFFNVSNKLLSPLSIVISTALVTLFPHFSKLYVSNKGGFYKQLKNAFILFTIIGIFGAFTVTLFRGEVVNLLFGLAYAKSSMVMSYQCWFLVINTGLLSLISNLLGAMDKQRTLSKITIIGSLISVPILWYGSRFGAENLSLAYLIFSLLQFSYCWFFLVKFSDRRIHISFFVKILIALLLFMVLALLLPDSLSVIIRLILFLVISGLLVVSIKKFQVLSMFK